MEYRAKHNQNHIWSAREVIMGKNARYGIVQLVYGLPGNEWNAIRDVPAKKLVECQKKI